MRVEQITRDHPYYHDVGDIFRREGLTARTSGGMTYIRVPDGQAWIVYPDRGRPHLEADVFALDDRGEPYFDGVDVVLEPDRAIVYID